MIPDGVTPQAVANHTVVESHTAFLNGDVVFCRNWPHMYGAAGDPEMSKITLNQVGVWPLPVGKGQSESTSCLGGWNSPVSPYYSEMSREMAEQFNNVLRGAISPEVAVETLQSELQRIIQQG